MDIVATDPSFQYSNHQPRSMQGGRAIDRLEPYGEQFISGGFRIASPDYRWWIIKRSLLPSHGI